MTVCKEEIVKVRGRSTRFFHGGKGAPLVFLHDAFCTPWLPIHDRLADEFEVFVPIHPGFSGSEDGFEQFAAMEDLVIHYLDWREALRLERPAVTGASFGGWIAAEWAVRDSENLGSLVLIGALGLRLPDAPAVDVLSLDSSALRRTLFAEPDSSMALEAIPDMPKVEAITSTILARRAFARFAWQFPDDPRLFRYLYRVRLPALILWGERDNYVPLMHAKAFQEGIADSKLAILPGAGHLAHFEAPEKCAEVMIGFVRERYG